MLAWSSHKLDLSPFSPRLDDRFPPYPTREDAVLGRRQPGQPR